MDKEYIDKNEILYQMSMGLIPQDYEWTRAYALARKLIKDAPVENVEPVRHGEWIEYQMPNIICCSKCDWGTSVEEKFFNYCPNCGAKMDGGNNTNETLDR